MGLVEGDTTAGFSTSFFSCFVSRAIKLEPSDISADFSLPCLLLVSSDDGFLLSIESSFEAETGTGAGAATGAGAGAGERTGAGAGAGAGVLLDFFTEDKSIGLPSLSVMTRAFLARG